MREDVMLTAARALVVALLLPGCAAHELRVPEPVPGAPASSTALMPSSEPELERLPDAVVEHRGGRAPLRDVGRLWRRLCAGHEDEPILFYELVVSRLWSYGWVCSEVRPRRWTNGAGAARLTHWLRWLQAEAARRARSCSAPRRVPVLAASHESGIRAVALCSQELVLSYPDGSLETRSPPAPARRSRAPRLVAELSGRGSDAFPPTTLVESDGRAARAPAPPTPELDGEPTRLALAPTARLRAPRELGYRVSDLLLHRIDYGLTRHLEVGCEALLPILYVGIFPVAKLGTRLSERWSGALQAIGGVFWPYAEPETIAAFFTGRFGLYGLGALATYQRGPFTLNLGVPVYGLRYGRRESKTTIPAGTTTPVIQTRMDFSNLFAVVPNAGIAVQVSRRVRLHLEAHLPLGDFADVGKLALLVYGARLSGRESFLELSFALPIYPGADELLAKIPTGIPMISTGLHW